AAGTANNEARLQYWALGNGTRAPYAGVKYLGGAVVYLNDRVNPTLQWSGDPAPSDGWTNSDGPFALLAQDSGLGVKTVTISAPQLTDTGSLKDSAGQRINDGRYALHVVADDGNPRSGVQSIEVKVDGTQVAYQTQSCPNGSCTMTLSPDYTFVGERFAEGDH